MSTTDTKLRAILDAGNDGESVNRSSLMGALCGAVGVRCDTLPTPEQFAALNDLVRALPDVAPRDHETLKAIDDCRWLLAMVDDWREATR